MAKEGEEEVPNRFRNMIGLVNPRHNRGGETKMKRKERISRGKKGEGGSVCGVELNE